MMPAPIAIVWQQLTPESDRILQKDVQEWQLPRQQAVLRVSNTRPNSARQSSCNLWSSCDSREQPARAMTVKLAADHSMSIDNTI
jgi:hypothetical protein